MEIAKVAFGKRPEGTPAKGAKEKRFVAGVYSSIVVLGALFGIARLGSDGIPACDDSDMPDAVISIVKSMPAMANTGVEIVDFADISETKSSDKARSCRAQITSHTGVTIPVDYQIYIDQQGDYSIAAQLDLN